MTLMLMVTVMVMVLLGQIFISLPVVWSLYSSIWCISLALFNQLTKSPPPCVVKTTGLYEHDITSAKFFCHV